MSFKRPALTAVLAVSSLTIASAAMAGTASAQPQAQSHAPSPSQPDRHAGWHWMRTLTTEVGAPFQLAVNHGRVFVADGATSTVSRIRSDGSLAALAHGPQPGEVAGLDIDASGRSMAYTWTDYSNGTTGLTIKTQGRKAVTADLSGYESRHNPDRYRTYGLPRNANQCAKDAIASATGLPATYRGLVDSHPYAVASIGRGEWVVADAAGNDLLKVDAKGRVSTVAVLPGQPLKITRDIAGNLGLPSCVVGLTYTFEPVPTDVEVGRHRMLWVSTLPGGPEGPSAGARGSVYTVNRWTGASKRVATGFAGATNLAVTDCGDVFVTELFAGRISKVVHGQPRPFVTLPNALSVEAAGDWLYAGTLAPMDAQGHPTGPGSVVKIKR